MKKIIALLLSLIMAFSVSAIALGEEAAQAEASYANFGEHLQAFLSKLNAVENDIYLTAQANDQLYQVLAGTNEDGVVNIMVGNNNQPLGTLQIDKEAAYLTYQGSSMAIRFDTVQNFITNLPEKLNGYLKNMGIDVQQIIADVQQLAVPLQNLATKLAPAIVTTEEDGVMTMTLNNEALGDLLVEGISEFLNDATIAEIYGHYAPMFNGPAFEEIIAAWNQNSDQVKQLAQMLQFQLTFNKTTQEFSVTCSFTVAEDQYFKADYNGTFEDRTMVINGTVALKTNDMDMSYVISEKVEKNSLWLDIPTSITAQETIYMNGTEFGTIDVIFELDDFGTPKQFKISANIQGQDVLISYADSEFVMTVGTQEVLYAAYKDGVFTLRTNAGQMALTAREFESDANHVIYEVKFSQYGTERTAYATCQILENEGKEYFEMLLTSEGQLGAVVQLRQTEKQAFPLIKDDPALNWITEEQLNGLLDSYVAQLLSNFR